MTIRVKIEVPAEEAFAVQIGRESTCGKVGENIGTVQPGSSLTTYFWKDTKLVLREVEKAPGVGGQRPVVGGGIAETNSDWKDPEASETPHTDSQVPVVTGYAKGLEDTVNAVLSSRESYPDY